MEQIGANIFVETVYPGINVGCIATEEGAICVDTPLLPGEAQRWMARIQSLGAELVRFVIYTSGQSERILGTQYFICDQQAPYPLPPHSVRPASRRRAIPFRQDAVPVTLEQSKGTQTGTVVAHTVTWGLVEEHRTDSFKQSMIDMFGDRDPDMADLEVILPHITFEDCINLFLGDVTLTLWAAAAGVLWVRLLDQHVLFAGDSVVVGTHPLLTTIDLQEWLAALKRLRKDPQFQDIVVVPGRGPLCDVSAIEPLTYYLHTASEQTRQVYLAGQSKADLNQVAAELLPLYPVADGQKDRVQRQIKLGLDALYDQFKTVDTNSE